MTDPVGTLLHRLFNYAGDRWEGDETPALGVPTHYYEEAMARGKQLREDVLVAAMSAEGRAKMVT